MSESMRPTRRPTRSSASARLAATVDFPTPPLPEATATLNRTFARIWAADGGGTGPPRGGAAEGGFTSRRIVTAETPGSARSFSVASRRISSAAFVDSVVISRRNETFPPPTVRSFTKPKETMSRDSPGNRTDLRASRTFSSVRSVVALMSLEILCQRGPRLVSERGDALPKFVGQGVAVLDRPALDGDRFTDRHGDLRRHDRETSAPLDLECAGDADRLKRQPRPDREQGRPGLEWKQLPGAGPRLLGKHDERRPVAQPLERRVDRRGAPAVLAPIHRNEAGRCHRPAQDRNAEEVSLGEKADPHRQDVEENQDVVEALMVRRDYRALAREPLGVQDPHSHARAAEDHARPGPPEAHRPGATR